jgi:hypothetical protein
VIGLLKDSYRNVIVLWLTVRLTKATVIGLLEGSKRKKIKQAVIASENTVKLKQHRLIVLVEGCYRNKTGNNSPWEHSWAGTTNDERISLGLLSQ